MKKRAIWTKGLIWAQKMINLAKNFVDLDETRENTGHALIRSNSIKPKMKGVMDGRYERACYKKINAGKK